MKTVSIEDIQSKVNFSVALHLKESWLVVVVVVVEAEVDDDDPDPVVWCCGGDRDHLGI